MGNKIWFAAALLTLACGSSTKTVRTPLKANEDTIAIVIKGAEAVGCKPSGHDEMIGIMIDCPEGGRIVFGHDTGENMREENEGEPYPIEVHCYDELAEKCQPTIDRILEAGRK